MPEDTLIGHELGSGDCCNTSNQVGARSLPQGVRDGARPNLEKS